MANKYIILKADDFSKVTKSVKNLDKLIKKYNLKISWGIIGCSFEKISNDDILWCKERIATENYHFFNHGYTHEQNEFEPLSFNEQIEHIEKTQFVVKEKLGITLDTFGAPCNSYNQELKHVLEKFNDIKYWYFGDNPSVKKVYPRIVNIEYPFFKPNYKLFKKAFEQSADKILVLQIHPNSWNFFGFYNFKKIIKYLIEQNCIFTFPSDLKEDI